MNLETILSERSQTQMVTYRMILSMCIQTRQIIYKETESRLDVTRGLEEEENEE